MNPKVALLINRCTMKAIHQTLLADLQEQIKLIKDKIKDPALLSASQGVRICCSARRSVFAVRPARRNVQLVRVPASRNVCICCSIMLSEAHVELANDRDL